ncbi:hypothetical protein N7455_007875 [Penicillium solitum]|uniref:Phenazine biosynthesis protein n=1 Tax=Penicillium solitum TaxID=60172 RepID=A0A1V6QLX8_9EURO|nr:uncharacterized protein PENSOL_c060G11049 [Penicillium solitum]KAF4771331.1 hypothetical protein HAV15_004338 [Penicillium sp. str. \
MQPTQVRLSYVTVDVFTQQRYSGNPLAIVKVPRQHTLTQEQKQSIAQEFNLSETVILHEQENNDNNGIKCPIDIFMTDRELPFAGHPTVGTAYLLGRDATSDAGKILTKAGEIPFQYDSAADEAFVEVPHDLHIHDKCLNHSEVHNAGFPSLVLENIIGSPSFVSIVKGMTFVLIELSSLETLSAVNSCFHGPISGLDSPWYSEGTLLGTYFYVKNGTLPDGTVSLSTRMIVGTLEDPATGSAASTLSGYLAIKMTQMDIANDSPDKGVSSMSTVKFNLEQGVDMGRRSSLKTMVKVDKATHEVCSIVLGGSVVKVMEGQLLV